MGIYASLIGAAIQGGIALYNANQSPNYPNPPKLNKINIPQTEAQALAAQTQGYQLSDNRFSQRYPLLWRGKNAEMGQVEQSIRGPVTPFVNNTLTRTGLEQIPQGNEFQTAQQMGLPVLAKLNNDRQNLNRIIAENPQRTGPLTGTQVASLMANNYQNQNTFNQQLLGIQLPNYAAANQQYVNNINAIGPAIGGLAQAGTQAYLNSQSPFQLGGYQQAATLGYVPQYGSAYGNPYGTGGY